MSTHPGFPGQPASPGGQAVPTVDCRVCGTEVPTAAFCGFCGALLSTQRGDGPDWLRVRAYAAAKGEHLLRMSMVSSLFPHLPHRSRAAFRAGLAIVVVLLIFCAVLRWQAPLIGISALGFAVLFVIYLEESDVYGDENLPLPTLVETGALGAGLGVVWALLTGPVAARSYAVIGAVPERVLYVGLVIPVGGAVLMLVPAVVVRLLRPPGLESLDGFLIGSLGAVAFAAAGTLTRLTPQLATGLVAHHRHVAGLLVEAGVQGVAVPVTAAAAGGLTGAALWLTRGADAADRPGRRVYGAILPAVLVVLAIYAGLGLIDITPLPPEAQAVLHLLVAGLAIMTVRIGVHVALLHEAHDVLGGEPTLCPECHHVVPDMAFCPNCGVANRASSRSSRNKRRLSLPGPADGTTES